MLALRNTLIAFFIIIGLLACIGNNPPAALFLLMLPPVWMALGVVLGLVFLCSLAFQRRPPVIGRYR